MAGTNRAGMGSKGYCVCIKCGYKKPHTPGIQCRQDNCPKCGQMLIREGSPVHREIMDKQRKKRKD